LSHLSVQRRSYLGSLGAQLKCSLFPLLPVLDKVTGGH
jgi:hypothetical protein